MVKTTKLVKQQNNYKYFSTKSTKKVDFNNLLRDWVMKAL